MAWLALILAVVVVAVVAVVAVIVLWVAEDDSAGPEIGATVSEVADDPSAFYGEQVTVSGQVDDVFQLGPAEEGTAAQDPGGMGFTLDDEDLLVVSAGDSATFLSQDDVVQVTGTVRDFQAEDFAEDFGWGFDEDLLADFAGPAIVASSVDPTVPDENGTGS